MPETLTTAQQAKMDRDLALLVGEPAGIELGQAPPLGLAPEPPGAEPKPLPHHMVHGQKRRTVWHWRRYPMGGWVYWQTPARMQRVDQGQDLEVPLGRHIIAPGWGKCIRHLSDRNWPGGFGSPYAVVYIGSGRFGGHLWYLGHCNAEVIAAGTTFHSGRILARPNHSLNSGWGWAEIGWAPNGYPGAWGNGARWHWAFAPVWKWSAS